MKIFTIIKTESTRCPRKNFREIRPGVPLWAYVLGQYGAAEVFVDTDSEALLRELQSPAWSFVTGYRRTREHEDAHNPTNEMFARFLDEHVTDDDEPVAYIHVTSPFLKPQTLDQMTSAFSKGYPQHDSAFTCTMIRNVAYLRIGNRLQPVNHNPQEIPRSQDVDPIVVPTQGAFVTTARMFLKTGSRVGPQPLAWEVSDLEAFDIDTEGDFARAVEIANDLP